MKAMRVVAIDRRVEHVVSAGRDHAQAILEALARSKTCSRLPMSMKVE